MGSGGVPSAAPSAPTPRAEKGRGGAAAAAAGVVAVATGSHDILVVNGIVL